MYILTYLSSSSVNDQRVRTYLDLLSIKGARSSMPSQPHSSTSSGTDTKVKAMAEPASSSRPRQWLTTALWRKCLFPQSHQGTDKSLVTSLCSKPQDAKAGTVTAQPEVTEAALGCSNWAALRLLSFVGFQRTWKNLHFGDSRKRGSRKLRSGALSALLVTRCCGSVACIHIVSC